MKNENIAEPAANDSKSFKAIIMANKRVVQKIMADAVRAQAKRLRDAVVLGLDEIVFRIISADGISVITDINHDRQTALMIAAAMGREDYVRAMIAALPSDIPLRAKNRSGRNAQCIATERGQERVAEALASYALSGEEQRSLSHDIVARSSKAPASRI